MIICSALQPNYKLKYQNRQRKRMLYLYNIVYFNSNFEWVFCLSCFHHCTIRRQTGTKMESSTLCIWCVRSSLLELPLSSKHQWCINSWILWKLYSHKEYKNMISFVIPIFSTYKLALRSNYSGNDWYMIYLFANKSIPI